MNEEERLQILEMIEKGIISAPEGVRLLNSLQGELDEPLPQLADKTQKQPSSQPETPAAPEVILEEPAPEPKSGRAAMEFDPTVRKWRRWWWIPLVIGITITSVSALLMFLAYQKSGLGFWFACLWFPLLLGVAVVTLAAASRSARWLHVRVQQEAGEWPKTIAISMPIPIRLTAWILRIFKPHIHGMENTSLDEVIMALNKTSPDQPFYVKVDESDSGEKVEVYIG